MALLGFRSTVATVAGTGELLDDPLERALIAARSLLPKPILGFGALTATGGCPDCEGGWFEGRAEKAFALKTSWVRLSANFWRLTEET